MAAGRPAIESDYVFVTQDVWDVMEGDVGRLDVESRFLANPVALWMHDAELGVIGQWTRVRFDRADDGAGRWTASLWLDAEDDSLASWVSRQAEAGRV